MIICLVQDATAVAGWILDVPNGRLAAAERGAGCASMAIWSGASRRRHRSTLRRLQDCQVGFDEQLSPEQRGRLGTITTLRCAGAEYLEILAGRANFGLYRTAKPWDHAAGTLMMRKRAAAPCSSARRPTCRPSR